MPWSVAGVYTRGYASWSVDAGNNLPISATKFDIEDNDFATGLNNCITKDGLSVPTVPITWSLASGQILQLNRGNDGTILALSRTGASNNPGLSFVASESFNAVSIETLPFGGSASASMNFFIDGTVTMGGGVYASANHALTIKQLGSSFALLVKGLGFGTDFGVSIQAGAGNTETPLSVQSFAGSNFFKIFGDGSIVAGLATGGNKGPGTLNVPTLWLNGNVVLGGVTSTGAQTATFTATNKPGSGTTAPTLWETVVVGATTYYRPLWQ